MVRNLPEDSITISTPASFQGISSGRSFLNTAIFLPSTDKFSPSTFTSFSSVPYVVSYLSKYAWDDASAHGISTLTGLIVSRFNTNTSKWENCGQASTTGGIGTGVSGSVTSSSSPQSYNTAFTFGATTGSTQTFFTGIVENTANFNSILVYPNPANSFINIQIANGHINSIYLINILGQVEQSWEGNYLSTQQIFLDRARTGIYQLYINTDMNNYSQPVYLLKK